MEGKGKGEMERRREGKWDGGSGRGERVWKGADVELELDICPGAPEFLFFTPLVKRDVNFRNRGIRFSVLNET